jgi:hypothetical protein
MNIITKNTTGFHKNILFNLLTELGYKDIEDFQSKNGLTADGAFGRISYGKLYSILLKVVEVNFEGYYFKTVKPKNQIIWHHSAGWDNARGMFDWWKNDGATHVGTSIGIVDDGTVFRGFNEEFWAASIGCSSQVFISNGIPLQYRTGSNGKPFVANNLMLDEGAVAVEVANWGNLSVKDGKHLSWANAVVPVEKVIELNYKTFKFYEAYTDGEIKALKYWTLLNALRFQIPVTYSYDDMFAVSKKALSGQKGLFSHNSYRWDKTDVSPQPKLIEMAKGLELYMK